MPLCLVSRLSDLILYYAFIDFEQLLRSTTTQSALLMVSGSIPVYLFFTTYILVCLFWIYLYYNSYMPAQYLVNEIRQIYGVINFIVYTFWAIIVILMLFEPHNVHYTIHAVETVFATIISFLAGILFLVYGVKLRAKLYMARVLSPNRMQLAKKVGYTTALCTFVFLLRGCMITLSFFVISKIPLAVYVNNVLWRVVIELIPSTLILFLIQNAESNASKVPTKRDSQRADPTTPLLNATTSTFY